VRAELRLPLTENIRSKGSSPLWFEMSPTNSRLRPFKNKGRKFAQPNPDKVKSSSDASSPQLKAGAIGKRSSFEDLRLPAFGSEGTNSTLKSKENGTRRSGDHTDKNHRDDTDSSKEVWRGTAGPRIDAVHPQIRLRIKLMDK
jgi:hypothetical protein